MTRAVAFVLMTLLASAAAMAQPQPFDMSPERGQQGSPATTPPERDRRPQPAEPDTTREISPAPGVGTRRYIVPFRELAMAGEADRRAWSFHLTPEQAAAPASLGVGYQNAIVVAPEVSKLVVRINNVVVVDEPVRSPDRLTNLTAKIPPGLLKSGQNLFSIESVLRHRTDCSIQSTYELWTEIDPSKTYMTFEGQEAGRLQRVDDIAAIGVDQLGATAFNFVVPAVDLAMTSATIVRLAEGLAMLANMPNQAVNVTQGNVPPTGPGKVTIMVGTPAELSGVLPEVPSGAAMSPVATFVENAEAGGASLVVSGPTWQSIDVAVENIVNPVDRPLQSLRTTLPTSSWRWPDPPLFLERGRRTLEDLGTFTQEFTGRRFRTDFAFGVPADFYADAYGEATLLLDAAYSPEVLPGSHIDIYVNGNIAANVPVTQEGGAIMRHFPVGVTMRHFRPGTNIVTLEAVLLTESDAICAPGATALRQPRFVLFDTTEFEMPNFARIARRPDLAGIAGTGFPYNRTEDPVPLLVQRGEPDALSAAVTMLARMSVVAGRPIRVDATVSPASVTGGNAIFVGAINDVAPQITTQVGISEEARTIWGQSAGDFSAQDSKTNNDATFDRWRQELAGRGWRGRVSALEDWLNRTFDISFGSLRLAPSEAPAYVPAGDISLALAQQASPDGTGTWTVLTAPSLPALRDGTQALARQENWSRISGQLTTMDASQAIGTVPVSKFQFFATRPFSFTNYRLIAANWLSANTLSYAAALFALCLLLGVATSALLRVFGRRK